MWREEGVDNCCNLTQCWELGVSMDSFGIKSTVGVKIRNLIFSMNYYIFLEFSWHNRIYISSSCGFIFTLDSELIKTVLNPTRWELRSWALRSRPCYNKTPAPPHTIRFILTCQLRIPNKTVQSTPLPSPPPRPPSPPCLYKCLSSCRSLLSFFLSFCF